MHEPDWPHEPQQISQSRYVAFHLQVQPNKFSALLWSKQLLQCYLVDMYASIDQNWLCFLCFHQPKLHTCLYGGLQDALTAADDEIDLNKLGQKVILPSSYIGGPHHMQQ